MLAWPCVGCSARCVAQAQVLHSTLTPHQSLETRQLTPTLPIPDAGEDARDEGLVEPTDVDAYWLQRRVSKCFPGMGAQESQALAEQAFAILQVPSPPTKNNREEKSVNTELSQSRDTLRFP